MSNKTLKEQPSETASAPKTKTRNTRHLVFGIVLVLVGVFALYNGISSLFDNTLRLLAPNGFITVEVVDTPESRALGLSDFTSLGDDRGMLFEFEDTLSSNCFWMKDMDFAIDMVWMNDNREVVTVTSQVAPESYPKTFCPEKPAKYGLEIGSGRAENLGITLGSKLRW